MSEFPGNVFNTALEFPGIRVLKCNLGDKGKCKE